MTEDLCDNALDLETGTLIIESNFPKVTYCQWLISAQDDSTYITLEFQTFNVRKILALEKLFICVNSNSSKLL